MTTIYATFLRTIINNYLPLFNTTKYKKILEEIELRHDDILQDYDYANNIHITSSEEDLISIFNNRGYHPLESEVIAFWKVRSSGEINRDLRDGVVNYKIQLLDNAIERSVLIKPYILYRGLGVEQAEEVTGLLPGETYEPKQFTATSTNSDKAREYAADGGKVILEIRTRVSMTGLVFGDIEYESEILLPRNIKLRIIQSENLISHVDNTQYIKILCEVVE